jgi:hypothetical protein
MAHPPNYSLGAKWTNHPSLASALIAAYAGFMTVIYHTPLSPDQQRAAGMPTPQPLAMADQVRFSDLDTNNHVNNTVYFEWFERLRIRPARGYPVRVDPLSARDAGARELHRDLPLHQLSQHLLRFGARGLGRPRTAGDVRVYFSTSGTGRLRSVSPARPFETVF